MAEQDPQNTPDPTSSPGAPDDAASSADDIADAVARSEEAAASLAKDTKAGPPPAGLDAAAANALKAAQAAIAAAKSHQVGKANGIPAAPQPVASAPQPNIAELAAEAVALPAFDGASPNGASSREIDLLADVNLNVTIELGRTRMLVEDVLRLGEGSVVELDKLAGDPVDVFVNGRHVARGEVLVVNDNFCVRVSEILSRTPGSDD